MLSRQPRTALAMAIFKDSLATGFWIGNRPQPDPPSVLKAERQRRSVLL